MDINQIENNSIIIVPQHKKTNIIKQLNNKLLNIKIMSLDEFIKKLTFYYYEKTIYYLMQKENIKY